MAELSPEEHRRKELYEQINENPDKIMSLLAEMTENRDWEQFGYDFVEYVEKPYDEGGLGWSRENLSLTITQEAPRERKAHKTDQRLQKMRHFVTDQLQKFGSMTVALTGGEPFTVNRILTAYDPSDDLDASDYAPTPSQKRRSKLEERIAAERPDLAEMVTTGEISLSAAAVEAGIREKRVSISIGDPQKTAKSLRKHMTEEQIADLVQVLLNWEPDAE